MTSRGRRTESDKPEGVYSTEPFADDVAAFMQALGIANAHISGLSLGAAIGMWLAAKYPKVPTQITFGRHDLLTSTRFADRMTAAIRGSELNPTPGHGVCRDSPCYWDAASDC
jgi:pimeloyl-ACP methyl ester carboxylesterase